MLVDSIGHRRLHPQSAFAFPEQAARFQREVSIEPDVLDVARKRCIQPGASLRYPAADMTIVS
jgi:hypothetical protein